MLLEDLPSEVLAQILRDGSSWAAIELWKSGCKRLALKLANGGVTELQLRDGRTIAHVTWPKCLKSFKLRSLSVSIHSVDAPPPKTLQKELKLLHPGLKHLSIAMSDCRFAFCGPLNNIDLSSSEKVPRQVKRPSLAEIRSNGALHEEKWDLNQTFDELELLEIIETFRPYDPAFHSSTTRCTFDDRFFALLPRSLTTLAISLPDSRTTWANFKNLPPNLTTLSVPALLTAKEYPDLPASITDLDNSLPPNEWIEWSRDAHILPNVIRTPCKLHLVPSAFEVLKAAQLPPSWTGVQAELTEAIFKALPRKTLTNLSLLPSGSDLNPGVHWFTQGDTFASLTHLYAQKIEWTDMNANTWPPQLTLLSLSSDCFIHATIFNHLSRNLKSLAINMPRLENGHGRIEPGDFNLTLSLANGVSALESELETWTVWKNTLATNPNAFSNRDKSASERYIESIESGMAYGLPLGLTTLWLGRHLHIHEFNLVLPPYLTKVRLEYVKSDELWELFPPFVTDLHLHAPALPFHEYDLQRPPTNWRIADFDRDQPPEDNPFYKLDTITVLELKYMNAPRAADDIRLIPRSVTNLHFGAIDTPLTQKEVLGLPSSLTRLYISVGLTNSREWIKDLPESLIHLEMPQIAVYADDLSILPRSLESLSTCIVNALVHHVAHLPPNLRKLQVLGTNNTRIKGSNDVELEKADWDRLSLAYVPFWRAIRSSSEEMMYLLYGAHKAAN